MMRTTFPSFAANVAAFALAALAIACGADEDSSTSGAPSADTPAESGSSDGTTDGRSDAPPAEGATAASGGGICCPMQSPCGPGYRGGWASSAAECVYEQS